MVQWTVTKLEPDLGTLEITLKIIIGNEKEFEVFLKKVEVLENFRYLKLHFKRYKTPFNLTKK